MISNFHFRNTIWSKLFSSSSETANQLKFVTQLDSWCIDSDQIRLRLLHCIIFFRPMKMVRNDVVVVLPNRELESTTTDFPINFFSVFPDAFWPFSTESHFSLHQIHSITLLHLTFIHNQFENKNNLISHYTEMKFSFARILNFQYAALDLR